MTSKRTGGAAAPARTRQRVMTPFTGALTWPLGIEVAEWLQPPHWVVSKGGPLGSELPIVTSAWAAGAAASTASIHATTTDLLIG
jgi:hypothetical protein